MHDYRNTLIICNMYCFCTAAVVNQRCVIIACRVPFPVACATSYRLYVILDRRGHLKAYNPPSHEELEILIKKKKNIVRFIKSQKLRWAAHVIRMDTTRIVKKVTEWEPCSSRPVGRPRLSWLDQVEEDLKKMKVRNWRERSVKIEECGTKS